MLVFTRNVGDGVSFPELDMAIEVLKIQGNRVRIGIKAAEEIRVLRSELVGKAANIVEPENAEARHELRNRLNAVSLAMSLSQKHIERGDIKNAELALLKVVNHLRQQAIETAEPTTAKVHSPKISGSADSGKIKVLLVEDNHNEGNLLAEVLALNNVDVHVVRDGAEALEALKAKTPDVVLLDMNMPNCDGKTTIEHIRKDQALKSLRVYAVTGSDRTEVGVKVCQLEGVNEWFQKPIQPSSLMQALKSIHLPCAAC